MSEDQISPDEEYERQRASAQKYSALRNRLGLEFRAVQQEAYESWCAWEEHMEALSEETEEAISPELVEDRESQRVLRFPKTVEEQGLDDLIEYASVASEKARPTQGESPQELRGFAPVATFDVEGTRYEAFRKDGNVFLRPSPIPQKTHLFLNEKRYPLVEAEESDNLCQVINLRTADLQSFLSRLRRNPSQYQIRFDA